MEDLFAKKPKAPALTTPELLALVMQHWAPPSYYCLTEVRNGTGYSRAEGYADVVAMSVWPSRGLELIGAELKVSRSDWLRELKDPAKAEKFVKFCHRWYLITGPDVARAEEIPASWGHMVASGKGLKTMKAAPDLTPVLPDYLFLAALFRKIGEAAGQGLVPASELNALADQRVQEVKSTYEQAAQNQYENYRKLEAEMNQLRENVQAFCTAAGVDLNCWRSDRQKFEAEGHLLRAFRYGGAKQLLQLMQQLANNGRHAIASIDEALIKYQEAENRMNQIPSQPSNV